LDPETTGGGRQRRDFNFLEDSPSDRHSPLWRIG
jgi:hypothetical protein